jgi:hypothetical protein
MKISKVQAIWWRDWHGLKWHRWQSKRLNQIWRGSLMLGWLEIRVWR